MNDINDLFRAVIQRVAQFPGPNSAFTLLGGLQATAARAAVEPRLYDTVAPHGAKFPHGVLSLAGGGRDWCFGGNVLEQPRIQLALYGKYSGDAVPLGRLWRAADRVLDNATLALLGGGRHIIIRRDGQPRKEHNDGILQISSDYVSEQLNSLTEV